MDRTDLLLQAALELGAVGETREWIVERLVGQFGQAVLESGGHRVDDACHGTELPVAFDSHAMSHSVDDELFEPQFEVPQRNVQRPAEMAQDEHRRRHRAEEHRTHQQEDPVRSVGHRGRVGDEVLTPDPVDHVQVGERLEGVSVGEGAEVDDVELAGVQCGAVVDEVQDVLAGLPERLVVARFEHRPRFVERRQHRADLLLERALDPVAPDLRFPDGQQVTELLAYLGDDRMLVDGSVGDLLDGGVRVQRAHHGQNRHGEARQQHSPQPAPQPMLKRAAVLPGHVVLSGAEPMA